MTTKYFNSFRSGSRFTFQFSEGIALLPLSKMCSQKVSLICLQLETTDPDLTYMVQCTSLTYTKHILSHHCILYQHVEIFHS